MANVEHRGVSASEVHIPYAFGYANAAARKAASLSVGDVGKLALQSDDQSLWAVASVAPTTWKRISSPFAAGVTDVTVLFRPRAQPGDIQEMEGYIVHGPHVTNFVKVNTPVYHPSGPVYEITLDRNYEADEIAVLVWPGPFDDPATNLADNVTGAWSGSGSGGLIHLPQVWQAGPVGQKNMRLVFPVTLFLDVDNTVTWAGGGHSDPLTIMLVFFDRTLTEFRNPALP